MHQKLKVKKKLHKKSLWNFRRRLKLLEGQHKLEDYNIANYLDDIKIVKGLPNMYNHKPDNIHIWLTVNERILVEDFTDEFEAWLKLQQ